MFAAPVLRKDRTRFQDFDHDLDLTYITKNIIAMAFPSSGIESVWRNHIDEVSSLLTQYHDGKFRIWNLSGRTYKYEKFNNQVLDFGFPDHHSPPLELLFRIISSIHEFLNADAENVAIVHCIGGKGRTGTVIAAYLAYTGQFASVDEALEHFAMMRSSKEKGVTQPSQRRYTYYFGQVLAQQIAPYPKTLLLKKIVMFPVPNFCGKEFGCRPIIKVYSSESYPKELLYSSCKPEEPTRLFVMRDEQVEIELNVLVRADVMIHLIQEETAMLGGKKFEKIFRITFHSAFITNNCLELPIDQIDDCRNRKKWSSWFEPDFKVRLVFEDSQEELVSNKPHISPSSLSDFLDKRTIRRSVNINQSDATPRLAANGEKDNDFYAAFFQSSAMKVDKNRYPSYTVKVDASAFQKAKEAQQEQEQPVITPKQQQHGTPKLAAFFDTDPNNTEQHSSSVLLLSKVDKIQAHRSWSMGSAGIKPLLVPKPIQPDGTINSDGEQQRPSSPTPPISDPSTTAIQPDGQGTEVTQKSISPPSHLKQKLFIGMRRSLDVEPASIAKRKEQRNHRFFLSSSSPAAPSREGERTTTWSHPDNNNNSKDSNKGSQEETATQPDVAVVSQVDSDNSFFVVNNNSRKPKANDSFLNLGNSSEDSSLNSSSLFSSSSSYSSRSDNSVSDSVRKTYAGGSFLKAHPDELPKRQRNASEGSILIEKKNNSNTNIDGSSTAETKAGRGGSWPETPTSSFALDNSDSVTHMVVAPKNKVLIPAPVSASEERQKTFSELRQFWLLLDSKAQKKL